MNFKSINKLDILKAQGSFIRYVACKKFAYKFTPNPTEFIAKIEQKRAEKLANSNVLNFIANNIFSIRKNKEKELNKKEAEAIQKIKNLISKQKTSLSSFELELNQMSKWLKSFNYISKINFDKKIENCNRLEIKQLKNNIQNAEKNIKSAGFLLDLNNINLAVKSIKIEIEEINNQLKISKINDEILTIKSKCCYLIELAKKLEERYNFIVIIFDNINNKIENKTKEIDGKYKKREIFTFVNNKDNYFTKISRGLKNLLEEKENRIMRFACA